MPEAVVPNDEMVLVPVIVTNSPSAPPMSVVEAEAMDAEAWALVLRTIAKPARMKSSKLLPIASEPAGLLDEAIVYRSAILVGTAMLFDPQWTFMRIGMGIAIGPAVAIVLYGTARLVAMAVAKWMPESVLKRRLLTDTETGRLAYKPRSGSEIRLDR